MLKIPLIEDFSSHNNTDFLYDRIIVVILSQSLYNNVLTLKRPCKSNFIHLSVFTVKKLGETAQDLFEQAHTNLK